MVRVNQDDTCIVPLNDMFIKMTVTINEDQKYFIVKNNINLKKRFI